MTTVLCGWQADAVSSAAPPIYGRPIKQLQQHVATEVQAGKDAAALLWRFA